MGTYEDLKNAIADVIYTNGNNEITGIILQQILQRVVSTIGIYATFAGIATPETDPGEIDQNVIYLASKPGIYDNFNGQNITSGIGIFSNKNGVWEYTDLGLQINLSQSVTYAELVTLRNNGNLTPGMLYRITDYVTLSSQLNVTSAGRPFDIIVLALSKSKLSEQAWATQSARDTEGYFSNSKLSAWKIWYCLDNDTSRFAWATDISEGGTGVIYRMIDEFGNDCPYDFYNILFRGWEESDNSYLDTNSYYYTFTYISQPNVNSLLNVERGAINNVKISGSNQSELGGRAKLFPVIIDFIYGDNFFQNISIGSRSSNVYIRSSARNTKIGYGCTNISILGAAENVNIGDVCTNIILGYFYTNVSIGNFCSRVGVVKDQEVPVAYVTNLKIGDQVTNFLLYNTETASPNTEVRNIEIKDGVNSGGGTFVMSVVRNQSANYTIATTTGGIIKIFNIADIIQ